jgi:putative endonuclease
MYWVYVLVNKQVGKRYIGHTGDLQRRLDEHNGSSENNKRFTGKGSGQWDLVYSEEHETRSAAMKREKWLKSGAGRQFLDSSIGRASQPSG